MKYTMKHSFTIALMAILGGTLATSCSSDNLMDDNNNKQPEIVTITAGLSKVDTRMNYTEEGDVMKTTWDAEDGFVINSSVQDPTTAKEFTIKAGEANKATATFVGEKPERAKMYYIFYPKSLKTIFDFVGFSYIGQEQDANNITKHIKSFHSMVIGVIDYTSFTFSGSLDVFNRSSIMKFELSNLPEAVTPTKIMLATNQTNSVNQFKPTNQPSNTSKTVELKLKNYSAVQALTAYLVMSSETTTLPVNSVLTVTVESTTKTYYKEITISAETKLEGGKLHKITVADGWLEKTI